MHGCLVQENKEGRLWSGIYFRNDKHAIRFIVMMAV